MAAFGRVTVNSPLRSRHAGHAALTNPLRRSSGLSQTR